MKIAVIGANGRMGTAVVNAAARERDLEVVAMIDADDEITPEALGGAEVAVEFTIPTATEANVLRLIELGVHVVVGTTGWTDESLGRVREALRHANADRAEKEQLGAVIAPNYALSAVLAMSFAAKAAPYFESAEIVELHHPDKVDAPSGTAVTTAERMALARRTANAPDMPDATQTDPHGARGAVIDGIHIHAVRLRGLTAHEEILLGNPGEQLSMRTDSFDRESFMPGVLLAVREVAGRPGLTYGLDSLLDL